MKKKDIYTLSVIDHRTGEPIETHNGLITSIYYNEKKAIRAGKKYETEKYGGEIVQINYGEYETDSGDIWGDIEITIPIAQHPAYTNINKTKNKQP